MFYTYGNYGVSSKRKTQGKIQKIKANNGSCYTTLNIYKYFQTNFSTDPKLQFWNENSSYKYTLL